MRNSSNPTDKNEITTEQYDELVYDASLKSMAGVLDGKKSVIAIDADPVVSAVLQIASFTGFPLKAPETALGGTSAERLKQYSAIAAFRTRNVILENEWYKSDCGAMLAFTEDGAEPVCLFPQGKSYQMINCVTGEKQRADRETAQTLQPIAVVVYKPFPNRAVTFVDMYKMSLRENKKDIITIAALGSVGGILGMISPMVTGILFDNTLPEAAQNSLYGFIIILACLGFAGAMFDITKGLCSVRIQGRISSTLQSALWDRLLALPVPFFRNFTSGNLASRSLGINAIVQTISGMTLNAVLSAVFSSYNLILLFYYSAGMALIAVLLTAVTVIFTFAINYYKIKKQTESLTLENQSMGFLFQVISGIAKIRMTGSYKRAFAKYAEIFTAKKRADFETEKAENILITYNAMFPMISAMVIFSWMIYRVEGEVSTGQFIAFNTAFGTFQTAVLNMTQVLTNSLRIVPLYDALKPILGEMPETNEAKSIPDKLKGSISADHVSFRYGSDSPLILDNVSMRVQEGQFAAVVGGSGAGKSTLLRLLLGFEKPVSGTIFYDDQDIDSLDVLEVRRQLGVVLQNDTLIQGSIMENIIGQSGTLTINDAWHAAEMAGIAEDIKQMPMGMHTVIPAGGGVLSGGQKQRVIIARALVKKPEILFFDEATSALDNKTQAEVSKNLEQLKVTRFVIAHRLSTIKGADVIYVMDKGRLVQQGTYDELIEQDGLFAELAKRQIS